MTSKQPWFCEGSPWKTEAAFWTWVRGVLRKGWNVHPIKIEFINRYRKRIPNPVVKNRKRFPECWGMTCELCKKDTAQKDIQIDHRGDSHSFTGLHDAASYMAHLFLVDFSSLRPLCSACHKIVNNAQAKGLTFEESKVDKEIIRLMKKENKQERLDILTKHKYTCRNDAERKQALNEIFSNEKEKKDV